MAGPDRGHRVLPHTADVILEAWAPDFSSCCEQAAIALLALCIDGSRAAVVDHYRFDLRPATRESMILDLLDEIIFVLDTVQAVPVGVRARPRADGEIEVTLTLAERESVEAIGSAPKAISRSGVRVDDKPGLVRCAFLVDV
jgi:SHS2 domain-containing protein